MPGPGQYRLPSDFGYYGARFKTTRTSDSGIQKSGVKMSQTNSAAQLWYDLFNNIEW